MAEANRRRRMERKLEEEKRETEEYPNTFRSDMRGRGKVNGRKLNDLEEDNRTLFEEIEEIKTFLYQMKPKPGGIEYMEKVFNNSLEIRNLFKDNKYDVIKFKIEKLRNAALAASKGLADVTEEERELLDDLSNASIFEARNLLEQHYTTLKSIFTTLLPYEIVKDVVTEVKEDLTSENKGEIGNLLTTMKHI